MSIKEIETAITVLSRQEVAELTDWLISYNEKIWDEQIENDLDEGKLDKLLNEIDQEYEQGLAKPL